MIHDSKQKYFTANAFQTFESFLWRLITDIRARFTFCEGFSDATVHGIAGKQIAKAKAKVSLSDDLWLRKLLKSYCLPLTSSLHTSLFISRRFAARRFVEEDFCLFHLTFAYSIIARN